MRDAVSRKKSGLAPPAITNVGTLTARTRILRHLSAVTELAHHFDVVPHGGSHRQDRGIGHHALHHLGRNAGGGHEAADRVGRPLCTERIDHSLRQLARTARARLVIGTVGRLVENEVGDRQTTRGGVQCQAGAR